MSIASLKSLFEAVKKTFILNNEDESILNQSNQVLHLLIAGPASGTKLNEEQIKYLYGEFLPGLAKRIVAVKTTKESYIRLISETVENMFVLLNVELAAKTPTLDDLADSCRVLFDPTQKYYSSHNQKVFEEEPKQLYQ